MFNFKCYEEEGEIIINYMEIWMDFLFLVELIWQIWDLQVKSYKS